MVMLIVAIHLCYCTRLPLLSSVEQDLLALTRLLNHRGRESLSTSTLMIHLQICMLPVYEAAKLKFRSISV